MAAVSTVELVRKHAFSFFFLEKYSSLVTLKLIFPFHKNTNGSNFCGIIFVSICVWPPHMHSLDYHGRMWRDLSLYLEKGPYYTGGHYSHYCPGPFKSTRTGSLSLQQDGHLGQKTFLPILSIDIQCPKGNRLSAI